MRTNKLETEEEVLAKQMGNLAKIGCRRALVYMAGALLLLVTAVGVIIWMVKHL